MVRSRGAKFTISLMCAASVFLGPLGAAEAQQEYDYSVNATLGQSDYRLYTMILVEETELTVSIAATGGSVDIYLLSAQGTSLFLSAMTTGSTSATWPYVPEMSEMGADSFSRTYRIQEQSTYSVAILNNQTSPVTVSGVIVSHNQEPSSPTDWTLMLVLIGVGAAAVLLVVVLVLIPRTYRLQAEVDSNARVSLGDELEPQQPRISHGGKCPYCGFRNSQGSMFCASCGEKII